MSDATATPSSAPAYGDVLKRVDERTLAVSRMAAKMAGSTLSYGVVVFLATVGASQLKIALATTGVLVNVIGSIGSFSFATASVTPAPRRAFCSTVAPKMTRSLQVI